MAINLSTIKEFLLKRGSNSTLNNLVKILHSKRFTFRFFWTIIFLLLMGICSFILIIAILNYFAYDIVTTIRIRTEIPAKMPKIIVCNSNSFTTNMSILWASYVYSLYGINKINNYLEFSYQQSKFPMMLNNKASILLPRTMAMSASFDQSLSDSFRQSLGITIKEMLISCRFNSRECSSNDFSWVFDKYYGNCFEFKTDHNKVSQSGKYNGLSMELFVGQGASVEQLAKIGGVQIFIVNETITTNTFSDGVNAPAGKETNILIDKKRFSKLKKPYGQCTPNLDSINSFPTILYKLTFEIYNYYRQKDCFHTCFQKSLIDHQGCYLSALGYLSNTTVPPCLYGLQLYNSLAYFTAFFIQDVAKKCNECPLECESESYSLTVSSLDYPTKIYAKMLANQTQILNRYNNKVPSYEELKQSIVSVNINYNELSYTHIKEIQKITLLDLIAKFGGTMNLALGLSFLSFYEIIDLIVQMIILFIENYISKRL